MLARTSDAWETHDPHLETNLRELGFYRRQSSLIGRKARPSPRKLAHRLESSPIAWKARPSPGKLAHRLESSLIAKKARPSPGKLAHRLESLLIAKKARPSPGKLAHRQESSKSELEAIFSGKTLDWSQARGTAAVPSPVLARDDKGPRCACSCPAARHPPGHEAHRSGPIMRSRRYAPRVSHAVPAR